VFTNQPFCRGEIRLLRRGGSILDCDVLPSRTFIRSLSLLHLSIVIRLNKFRFGAWTNKLNSRVESNLQEYSESQNLFIVSTNACWCSTE
jgi:hypothetical protein